MAKYKVGFKRSINIGRVVGKVAGTVIALWVGGTIIIELGKVMNATTSPFYKGLTLIGWTVETVTNSSATTCGTNTGGGTVYNCITSTTGSGVLAVVGIVGLASIIMEFVEFRMG